MDIKACQVFLHLADTLHFGRAAAQSHLSPSAVSRQLQRLESDVGHALFERDSRKVMLTPAGRHFLDYARKAVDDWQQLCSELNSNQNSLAGEISVFGSVTASYSLWAQILPKMREAFPGIEIKIRTGDQADGIEHVLNGTEDCAIIANPGSLSSKLAFLPLQRSPLRLVGPKTPSTLARQLDRYLEAAEEPDWSTLPMVIAERGLARDRLLDHFTSHDQRPNIYAQVAGHEAVVAMVSLGFGVAVVPELVIEHSPKRDTVRVLPWLTTLQPFSIGLCALRERLKDPLLQAFWECAQNANPAH